VVSLAGHLNIKVSTGSVCNIHHLAGKILEEPYEEIKQYTLQQAAIHADETSWYRKGKRQWLWIITGVKGALVIDLQKNLLCELSSLFGEILFKTVPYSSGRLRVSFVCFVLFAVNWRG